jgi:hypothetical protein
VIGENDERIALRGLDFELRAIATEDEAAIILVVDMAGDRHDIEFRPGHDPDIDAPVVIAVDQHDVIVGCALDGGHHVLAEPDQRRTALRFHDPKHVSVDLLDDPGGIAGGLFIDLLQREVDPSDPVVAPVCHDFDRFAARRRDQMPAVLAQDREFVFVGFLQAELVEKFDDLFLVGRRVLVLAEDGIDVRLRLQDFPAFGGKSRTIEGACPHEEVFHVVGCKLHGGH